MSSAIFSFNIASTVPINHESGGSPAIRAMMLQLVGEKLADSRENRTRAWRADLARCWRSADVAARSDDVSDGRQPLVPLALIHRLQNHRPAQNDPQQSAKCRSGGHLLSFELGIFHDISMS